MVILIPIQTTVALAENLTPDHTYISIDMSRTITTNFDFCIQKNNFYESQITLLDNKNLNLIQLSDSYKEKLLFVEADKEIFRERGDKFEIEYSICADELNKCQVETPSKFTWFGVGFVSAAVLGIVGIVLVK